MKLFALVFTLIACLFVGFVYFHGMSTSRAMVISSKAALKSAQNELRERGSVTNQIQAVHIEIMTNRLMVEGRMFQAELLAHVPALTNEGYTIITSEGAFIWNDLRDGPMVIGGRGFEHKVPPRYKDF